MERAKVLDAKILMMSRYKDMPPQPGQPGLPEGFEEKVMHARLRIGVDAPRDEAVDHVLGRFRPAEKAVIDDAVALAAQAVLFWARQGVAAAMNKYNAETKDKGGKNLN